MNTENRVSAAFTSPSSVAAVMIAEQAERAEFVRVLLIGLESLVKPLLSSFRPARRSLPQAGSWA